MSDFDPLFLRINPPENRPDLMKVSVPHIDDDKTIMFEMKRVPVSFFRFDPPKPPKNWIKAWFWHRKREYNAAKWIGIRTIPPNWANRVIDARRRYWYKPKFWTLHKLGKHTNYCHEVFECPRGGAGRPHRKMA